MTLLAAVLSGRTNRMNSLGFTEFSSGSSGSGRIFPYRPLRGRARARAMPGNRIFRTYPVDPDGTEKSTHEIMQIIRPDRRNPEGDNQ